MERLVATEMTFESPIRVEFDLPQRSSCRIRDKEIASGIKGKAIGDQGLRAKRTGWTWRRRTADGVKSGVSCRCGHCYQARRQVANIAPHTTHSVGVEINFICHRLGRENLL